MYVVIGTVTLVSKDLRTAMFTADGDLFTNVATYSCGLLQVHSVCKSDIIRDQSRALVLSKRSYVKQC